MDNYICRTCLKRNLFDSEIVSVNYKIESNGMSVTEMLEVFMPEMDIDISCDETFICLRCVDLLKSAYSFKKICLKSQETIYDYMHTFSVQIGEKINLQSVLEHSNDTNLRKEQIIEIIDLDDTVENVCQENIVLLEELTKVVGNDSDCEEPEPPTKKRKAPNIETPPNAFKCEFCSFSCHSDLGLRNHLRIHGPRGKCEICKIQFNSMKKRRAHDRDIHNDRPHKCKDCDATFVIRSQLRQHVKENHLFEEKKCPVCFVVDCRHNSHHCNFCRSRFQRKNDLLHHIEINHPKKLV